MRPSGNAFISRCSMKTCPSFDENKLYRSIKNIIVDPRYVQLESQQELWNIIRLSCLVFSTEWQNKKWIFYLPFTIQIRSPLPLSSTHFKFQVSTQQRSCHSQSMTFKYNAIVVFVALTWKNFFFFWCFEMPSKVSKVCNKIQPHTHHLTHLFCQLQFDGSHWAVSRFGDSSTFRLSFAFCTLHIAILHSKRNANIDQWCDLFTSKLQIKTVKIWFISFPSFFVLSVPMKNGIFHRCETFLLWFDYDDIILWFVPCKLWSWPENWIYSIEWMRFVVVFRIDLLSKMHLVVWKSQWR